MKQTVQPITRFKFGVFEADIRTGELTKLGKRVRLQEQPFQLLAKLLEKPGELVTREELRDRLWPKTIVDFDHGLNKAISKVREALGDSAENPRFVETVARRGLQMVAGIHVAENARLALIERRLSDIFQREVGYRRRSGERQRQGIGEGDRRAGARGAHQGSGQTGEKTGTIVTCPRRRLTQLDAVLGLEVTA